MDRYNDKLTLTVQDLITGQTTISTFVNDMQTIATEIELSERNWDPEQFDLDRMLDQQLKDDMDLVVSKYASTAIDTLQEKLMKKLRYMLLPRWKQQMMNDFLSRSERRLVPTTEKKAHSLPLN